MRNRGKHLYGGFWGKGFLKIYSKFTGDTHAEVWFGHGCSSINLLHIFRTPFPKNTLNDCFWIDSAFKPQVQSEFSES